MPAPQHGKIGYRIQDEEKWTGQVEEVPHQQVRRPGRLKLRQAVKHIEGIIAFFLYDVVNLHREGLKAVGQGDLYNPQPLHRRKNRFMLREPDVKEVPSIPQGLFRERYRHCAELIQRTDFPDHIVSQADIIQCGIHGRNTG